MWYRLRTGVLCASQMVSVQNLYDFSYVSFACPNNNAWNTNVRLLPHPENLIPYWIKQIRQKLIIVVEHAFQKFDNGILQVSKEPNIKVLQFYFEQFQLSQVCFKKDSLELNIKPWCLCSVTLYPQYYWI